MVGAEALQARLTQRAPSLHLEHQPEATILQDIIAGGLAGSAGIIVGHPFDTIKVRLQMGQAQTTTTAHCIRSLFRGIGAPVATAALVNATIFSSFGYTSRIWEEHYGASSQWKNVAGGAVAGIVSSVWLCPSEHVKVRLQSCVAKDAPQYRNTLDATMRITQSHGIVGLYRGLVATMTRQVPSFGVYFGSYDYIKERCSANFGSNHDWLASIVAGGTAGSTSWAIVYPIDLIKSRIQNLPLNAPRRDCSMWHVGRNVVHANGWRALYRGLGITVVRAFPVNGIIFCVYELSLRKLVGGAEKFHPNEHLRPEML